MSQRKFLVQGSIRGRAFGPFPIPVTTIATLEPGEAFDESTVLALQHMLLEQNPGAEMARVLGFSPLEEKAPVTHIQINPLTFDLLNDAEREHIQRLFETQGLYNAVEELDVVSFAREHPCVGCGCETVEGLGHHAMGCWVVPGLGESPGKRIEVPIKGWPGDEMKLNPGSLLPPVDCPLLIEVAPDVLVPASRPTFAESKGDQLVFETDSGLTIIGRPRWTYP